MFLKNFYNQSQTGGRIVRPPPLLDCMATRKTNNPPHPGVNAPEWRGLRCDKYEPEDGIKPPLRGNHATGHGSGKI